MAAKNYIPNIENNENIQHHTTYKRETAGEHAIAKLTLKMETLNKHGDTKNGDVQVQDKIP